jgi:hypothetical protein
MALGAQTAKRAVDDLREAVMLARWGIIVGLPFVFAVTRFASSMRVRTDSYRSALVNRSGRFSFRRRAGSRVSPGAARDKDRST